MDNALSIHKQIRKKRKKLLILIEKNGLNDRRVLKCSQELDVLIYQIQLFDRQVQETASITYHECGGL
nr:aspartyl-phosphate phosphatase Spo0E family protein [Neobacillus sp. Marseille-Q6967]